VPLSAGASAIPDDAARAVRLRAFCDAYRLDDRSALLDSLRARAIYVGRFVAEEAKRGDLGMQRLVAQNVPRAMFENDVRYLDDRRALFERAIG
jgi:hypothetical protein